MRTSRRITVFALLLCTGLVGAIALAQQHDHGAKPAAAQPGGQPGAPGGMTAEQQKDMDAMTQAGTPGPEHKQLTEHFSGTWDASVSMWMDPNSPPMTSLGTMKYDSIYGGRYIHMSFKGDFMGQPFEGGGVIGYDNTTKKYFTTWMDSMSTAIMLSTGTWDPASKQYTFTADMAEPTTGKMVKTRSVLSIPDANHATNTMYVPDKTGNEMKCMEIKYTKKM